MNVILLGAPGAGKGTQATKIVNKTGVPHISTGDIFRYNIKNQTPIGKVAKSYIDKGELVPDSVTVEIVKDRLSNDDCSKGYLLDGFPRNIYQAQELDKFSDVEKVIDIEVDLSKLLKRITGRRVCSKCGESYHIDFLNGKTVCDLCGGELIQRADDNEETVKQRLDVYEKQTAPLVEYYEKAGKLIRIDGDKSIDEVFEEISSKLG